MARHVIEPADMAQAREALMRAVDAYARLDSYGEAVATGHARAVLAEFGIPMRTFMRLVRERRFELQCQPRPPAPRSLMYRN